MTDRIKDAVAKCNEIIANSKDCVGEIDLLLGALSRHPDWTERDCLELHRELVLSFADQLCEQR